MIATFVLNIIQMLCDLMCESEESRRQRECVCINVILNVPVPQIAL